MISKVQAIQARKHLRENLRNSWTEVHMNFYKKDSYNLYTDLPEWELYKGETFCGRGYYQGRMMEKIKIAMTKGR